MTLTLIAILAIYIFTHSYIYNKNNVFYFVKIINKLTFDYSFLFGNS